MNIRTRNRQEKGFRNRRKREKTEARQTRRRKEEEKGVAEKVRRKLGMKKRELDLYRAREKDRQKRDGKKRRIVKRKSKTEI